MLPFVPVKDGQKDLTFVVTVVQFCLGKCGFGILLFLESWKLETKEFSGLVKPCTEYCGTRTSLCAIISAK